MKRRRKRKCRHCAYFFLPDPRNARHQRFCSEPECHRASKAASQAKWLNSPKGQGYFSGPDQVERVRTWRKKHPDHVPKPRLSPKPLQDPLNPQPVDNKELKDSLVEEALQDLCSAQNPLVVGLISSLTGDLLQDDIAESIIRIHDRGCEILDRRSG